MWKVEQMNNDQWLIFIQVNIQKEKDTTDLNSPLLMKTRMVTGCWLEMFHGSKSFVLFLSFTLYLYN